MSTNKVEDVAKAMKCEYLGILVTHMPIEGIWMRLAKAAIKAMRDNPHR